MPHGSHTLQLVRTNGKFPKSWKVKSLCIEKPPFLPFPIFVFTFHIHYSSWEDFFPLFACFPTLSYPSLFSVWIERKLIGRQKLQLHAVIKHWVHRIRIACMLETASLDLSLWHSPLTPATMNSQTILLSLNSTTFLNK